MIAWCARCNDPQECDERGCIVCAVLREKARETRQKRGALSVRKQRSDRTWTTYEDFLSVRAKYARKRRTELAAAGYCISSRNHPKPAPGKTRCERCIEVHRRTA